MLEFSLEARFKIPLQAVQGGMRRGSFNIQSGKSSTVIYMRDFPGQALSFSMYSSHGARERSKINQVRGPITSRMEYLGSQGRGGIKPLWGILV